MSVPYLNALAKHLKTGGAAEAASVGQQTWSYDDLAGAVRRFQALYAEKGVEQGDVVGIFASASIETYAACIAALLAGVVYMPLNPSAPASRNIECINQSRCRLLVNLASEDAYSDWLHSGPNRSIVSWPADVGEHAAELRISARPEDVAYLLFTSGSTGVPKGVPVHHYNVNAFLDAVVELPGMRVQPADRFLQMFELTFDLSVMSYLLPLVHGASFHVPSGGIGFLSIPKTLADRKITVALMVPSVLAFLEKYFAEIRLPVVRTSLFCGEALSSRLAQAWSGCVPNARILNVYGPTEATIFCSCYELPRDPSSLLHHKGTVAIGEPMQGTSFRIVDDALASVAPGDVGELLLCGSQVTTGYWDDPARTARAFVTLSDGTRAYRTGDSACLRDKDYLYVGRIDNQLKIDGFRVEPGEIEYHARSVAGVVDAVVVGSQDEKSRLVLFVVASSMSNREELSATIRTHIAASLPRYMCPQRVRFVESYPLNSNGKVDRRALSAMAHDD